MTSGRMPTHGVPPSPGRLVALGLVSAGLVLATATVVGSSDPDLTLRLLAGVAALCVVYLAWYADPAWTLSLGIASMVFSGNWGHLGLPAADRVLIGLGLASAIIHGVRAGLPPLRPVHLVMAAAAIYAVISAFWVGTLSGSNAMFGLIDRYGLLPFALFALAPVVYGTARRRSILLGTLVVTGGYLGLTAVFEKIGPTALVIPAYITDPGVGIHFGRARGPFVEASANGVALIICGVAASVGVAVWRDRRVRIASGAVVLLCALGALLTLTRSVWLAAGIGAIVALASARELRRFLLPAVLGGALLVVGALMFIPALSGQVEERSADKLPVWDRENLAAAAVRMIDERPLLGFGWGTFEEASIEYFRQGEDYPQRGEGLTVHNVFLWNASELGLVGATIWLVALLMAVGGAILRRGPPDLRPWRIGLIAVAIGWTTVAALAPLAQAFPNCVLWLWAGVASSAWLSGGSGEGPRNPGHAAPSARASETRMEMALPMTTPPARAGDARRSDVRPTSDDGPAR